MKVCNGARLCEHSKIWKFQGWGDHSPHRENCVAHVLRGRFLVAADFSAFSHCPGRKWPAATATNQENSFGDIFF